MVEKLAEIKKGTETIAIPEEYVHLKANKTHAVQLRTDSTTNLNENTRAGDSKHPLKLSKEKVWRVVKDGALSFAWFTGTLTPYMLEVVKTTVSQYEAWVGMQAILVPPIGAAFIAISRKLKEKGWF